MRTREVLPRTDRERRSEEILQPIKTVLQNEHYAKSKLSPNS